MAVAEYIKDGYEWCTNHPIGEHDSKEQLTREYSEAERKTNESHGWFVVKEMNIKGNRYRLWRKRLDYGK